jgi:hypothetical protein
MNELKAFQFLHFFNTCKIIASKSMMTYSKLEQASDKMLESG